MAHRKSEPRCEVTGTGGVPDGPARRGAYKVTESV
jgi:hypothetical protein